MYMAAMYIMHEKHGCGPRRKSRHTYVHAYNHTFIIYIYIYFRLWLLYMQTAKYVAKHVRPHLAISMQKDAVLATAHVYQKHSDCTKVQIGSNWYKSYTWSPCFLSTTRTSPNLQETPTQKWRLFPLWAPGHVPEWLFLPRRAATMPRRPSPWCPVQLLFMDLTANIPSIFQ